MTKNLFDISDDLLALDALLEEIGGKITDEEALDMKLRTAKNRGLDTKPFSCYHVFVS